MMTHISGQSRSLPQKQLLTTPSTNLAPSTMPGSCAMMRSQRSEVSSPPARHQMQKATGHRPPTSEVSSVSLDNGGHRQYAYAERHHTPHLFTQG